MPGTGFSSSPPVSSRIEQAPAKSGVVRSGRSVVAALTGLAAGSVVSLFSLVSLSSFGIVGCALAQALDTGGGDTSSSSDAGTSSSDAGDAGVTGASCGVESGTGANLCRATSACPNVVVDSEAMPHCGFRIQGALSELVCGCGDFVCPMGTFTTCAQAATLLTSQTEQLVCTQVADERCTATGGGSSSSSGGSSGSSGSGGNPACDRQCMAECGGGGACASVCNCD